MTIKLDNKFTITSDSTSFSLMYLPEKKDGSEKEPTPRAVGHYGDLQSALKGYIKNEMRQREIHIEVRDTIDYMDDLFYNIEKAVKGSSKCTIK